MSNKVYQIITDRIIEQLEKGWYFVRAREVDRISCARCPTIYH